MSLNVNGKRSSNDLQDESTKRFTGSYHYGREIWAVQWRNPQTKKHKTWENDGVLLAQHSKFILFSSEGVTLSTTKATRELEEDAELSITGREVRIDHPISQAEFASRTCFRNDHLNPNPRVDPNPQLSTPRALDKFTPLRPSFTVNSGPRKSVPLIPVPLVDNSSLNSIPQASPQSLSNDVNCDLSTTPSRVSNAVPSKSFYKSKPIPKPRGALHDPDAEGAIIMKHPPDREVLELEYGAPAVQVVIDPILARHLRPHQVEGVKFLYECAMGFRGKDRDGCILADEMGLGKTLQIITLVWTLLKQSFNPGKQSTVGKVLIACPVSLVQNWTMEFYKWLGRDRINILTGDKDKNMLKTFKYPRPHQILIIGYERLRTVIDDLHECMPPIGLIICDEGHRLKSSSSKVYKMFDALNKRHHRRIILSGTPIQNDLSELHAMADFCNPGLLGDYTSFRKKYEHPIVRSRAPDSSIGERDLGEVRAAELLSVTKTFVLRREASLLSKYLPPKVEYVLFVKATELQMKIFANILHPDKLNSIIQGASTRTLALINQLTKISNSPELASKIDAEGVEEEADVVKDSWQNLFPASKGQGDVTTSGKLTLMGGILRKLYKHTNEKCVIVSHYTATLDIIEAYCAKKKYSYFRLDGQTPSQKRQEYVNKFNKESQKERFVFLLSAKAGGVGLNLIGASRLIMIDSDWNPSHDLQAMARIHRDGQKHPVFIYRLLTCGTIDEKIYQRQITKMGLSETFIGVEGTTGETKNKGDSFTSRELRDIFTIQSGTECHTHDLLDCQCPSSAGQPIQQKYTEATVADDFDILQNESDHEDEVQFSFNCSNFMPASQLDALEIYQNEKAQKNRAAALKSLAEWTHVNCLFPLAVDTVQDEILSQLIALTFDGDDEDVGEMDQGTEPKKAIMENLHDGAITFLFEKRSELKIAEDKE